VSAEVPAWLAPGGHLLFEASHRQIPRAVDILTRDGLISRVADSEELDATVVLATRPAV
jgi:release factor glutamine methyltransferase